MKYYTNFNPCKFNTYIDKKSKKKKNWDFECDDILTLDIEVSSAWITEDGSVIPYHPYEQEVYWNKLTPISLCYIWQFSFNDEVYFGREFKDFLTVLDKLPKNIHFIIYVHNLGYEFTFLQNIFHWEEVFARDSYKVMKCTPLEYPNIEFRCSLFLTRLSLESWGIEIGLPKMVGDLNYDISDITGRTRTPLTPLTEQEMGYCQRDCEVVYKGILKYLGRYKHIDKIPLTQTGEVRKVLKAKIRNDKKTYRKLLKLIPQTPRMYKIMEQTFAGGYTHANFINAGITFKKENDNLPLGYGVAYDFCSSYPAVMVSEKYPMTPFTSDRFNKDRIDEYAYLIKIRFEDMECKTYNHYISYNKAFDFAKDEKGKDIVDIDNGRIINAKGFSIWITELDWKIITKTYKGKYKVLECYSSKKGYLPTCIVEAVLEFYNKKTQYKDVEGYEDIYMQNKQFLNSIFGCEVQKLTPDEIVYDNTLWTKITATREDIRKQIEDLQTNNKGRTYTAYQWGVWITAYGRYNLWKCMQHKEGNKKVDEDVIYCDTDSLKICDEYDFNWYNNEIDEKMKKACEYHNIDFNLTRPKSPDGKERPLGRFEREDDWIEFKTLGAKRYCYRGKKDGKLHLTVSGINKKAVDCLNDDIENFNEETVFDKDNPSVSKKLIIHNNNQPSVIWNEGYDDEYFSEDRYGIVMRPTSYSISIADEYAFLIGLSIC